MCSFPKSAIEGLQSGWKAARTLRETEEEEEMQRKAAIKNMSSEQWRRSS
jgi:hypothetical protein